MQFTMTNRSPFDPGDESSVRIDGASYQWEERDGPAISILEAVADATGIEPTALPTLHDAVDVDAVNRVLSGSGDGANVSISFRYANRLIVVDDDGRITVES